jgi:hypothetical protein
MYRGRRVWNKTRKRDAWGQQRQHDRPVGEWLTINCEDLRIVSDAEWTAAHDRMRERREAHDRWSRGQPNGSADGRGVRTRYFLTGFGRCACCGGSMQAVSRLTTRGERLFRYCCASYWNRGASVCANGRQLDMPTADGAVHELLRKEVLQPAIIERALDLALDTLTDSDDTRRRDSLERQLRRVESELENLSESVARGGAVPAILAALATRDEERRRLVTELAALEGRTPRRFNRGSVKKQLRGCLDDWSGLLTANVTEARPLLSIALPGERIAFQQGGYELTVPVAFDRMMSAAVPELGRRQDRVASPMPASWNQIAIWVKQIDSLRHAA